MSPSAAGCRLDKFLADELLDRSRVFAQRLVKRGAVTVNGQPAKPSHVLRPDDVIEAVCPEPEEPGLPPEDIELDVLYEDEHLIVINKVAGMLVHPPSDHCSGTIANALVFHCQQLAAAKTPLRPGIVHRLDRDTTGVLIAAKHEQAHERLARQFELRQVKKKYLAIVEGEPSLDADTIDLPIGRDPRIREKMAVRHLTGRRSITTYQVLERFRGFALVEARPKTGRTHQIRVHLASLGCPVTCDPTYGRRKTLSLRELTAPGGEETAPPVIQRHALHAAELTIGHPYREEMMTFSAELPADMACLLEALRAHRRLPSA